MYLLAYNYYQKKINRFLLLFKTKTKPIVKFFLLKLHVTNISENKKVLIHKVLKWLLEIFINLNLSKKVAFRKIIYIVFYCNKNLNLQNILILIKKNLKASISFT